MQCCKDSLRLPITVNNMGCRSELGRFPLIKDVLINVIKFDMRLKSDINQELLQAAHFSQEQLSKNSQNTYTHCQFIQRVSDELHLESNGTFQCNQFHLLKSKLKTEGKKISPKSENYYIGKIYKPFMSTNHVHAKLHLYSQVKDDLLKDDLLKGVDTKDPSLIEKTDYVLSVKHVWEMKYMHLWNAKVTSLKTLDLHTCLKLKHCSQIWRV